MTDKPEFLACPFCGSEALHYDNAYATCGKYRCPMNGVVVKSESWNTRAAPAEDVRAVGEKPVAYQVKVHGMTLYWDKPSESARAVNTPLYRRPQRPFVLPERKHLGDPTPLSLVEGWNACLDAVEELNK